MRYKVPVSVIMPCYNSSLFVSKAIKSILSQSFETFELIIVNDGSVDDTELQIKKFNDHRIVYIKFNQNKGKCTARNAGISAAVGKYICMIDFDDIAPPNRLELQYNFLESNLNVGCLGGAHEITDETYKVKGISQNPLAYSVIKVWLLKDCFINNSTIMIRSNLIRKHNLFYNENYKKASDYDFLVRASKLFPVRNLDDVLIKHRYYSYQISAGKKIEQIEIDDIIRKEQLKQFNIKPAKEEIDIHLKLIKEQYVSDDNLKLCEDWCNKLLEANEKVKLFNNNELYNLLEYSLQMAVKNNSLGEWSIEKKVLNFIDTIILKGDPVLEFGSGMGTEALLEKYKVTSIEHDERFCFKRGENHNIIHSPIENNWYDKKAVLKALEKTYALIIVDGPPGELRAGILQNIHLFNKVTSAIIFDDIDRSLDKEVMEKFCNELNYTYKIVRGSKKEFAICTKID